MFLLSFLEDWEQEDLREDITRKICDGASDKGFVLMGKWEEMDWFRRKARFFLFLYTL
jgi:hypothetical protein